MAYMVGCKTFGELAFGLTLTAEGADARDTVVKSITNDSRKAEAGGLFVCVKGYHNDGHAYAMRAYNRGCRLFVSEQRLELPADAAVYRTPDTRVALATLTDAYYGHPQRELLLVGVTGTKGKTTVSVMIAGVLNALGIRTGYIGTGGVSRPGYYSETENTTPESCELHRIFREMADDGVRVVVMEVSSQAILLHRVHGIRFTVCMFTNLARDHIGESEHPTFENYRDCKAALFADYGCRVMLYNRDDPASGYMLKHAGASVRERIGWSLCHSGADVFAEKPRNLRTSSRFGVRFRMHCAGEAAEVEAPMPGAIGVENAMAAIACADKVADLLETPRSLSDVASAVGQVCVRGRFESVHHAPTVLVDYAHNSYSLAAALRVLREYRPCRLWCLFGSVGERTRERRKDLACIAADYADVTVITSDNPGREDPEKIVQEIYLAFRERAEENGRSTECVAIADRRQAILYAVTHMHEDDILLLAGKGHENYQLIGTVRVPFDEREVVRDAIRQREAEAGNRGQKQPLAVQ